MNKRAPEMSFEDVDQAVIVDVKTDPEQGRVVALAMMTVTLSELAKGKVEVTRMRETYCPDQSTSVTSSGVDRVRDASGEQGREFSDDATELRTFIGDLPIIGHGVAAATAFLDHEFRLAGVRTLAENRKYCTEARLTHDRPKLPSPSLSEMATALNLRRKVRSNRVDEIDKDAATILFAAVHFWTVDNHSSLRSPMAERHPVSYATLVVTMKVLAGAGLLALVITKLLPVTVGLVLLLALIYWIEPAFLFIFLFIILVGLAFFGWMAWAASRAEELDGEQSDE